MWAAPNRQGERTINLTVDTNYTASQIRFGHEAQDWVCDHKAGGLLSDQTYLLTNLGHSGAFDLYPPMVAPEDQA